MTEVAWSTFSERCVTLAPREVQECAELAERSFHQGAQPRSHRPLAPFIRVNSLRVLQGAVDGLLFGHAALERVDHAQQQVGHGNVPAAVVSNGPNVLLAGSAVEHVLALAVVLKVAPNLGWARVSGRRQGVPRADSAWTFLATMCSMSKTHPDRQVGVLQRRRCHEINKVLRVLLTVVAVL